jgi:hypothetical protein
LNSEKLAIRREHTVRYTIQQFQYGEAIKSRHRTCLHDPTRAPKTLLARWLAVSIALDGIVGRKRVTTSNLSLGRPSRNLTLASTFAMSFASGSSTSALRSAMRGKRMLCTSSKNLDAVRASLRE